MYSRIRRDRALYASFADRTPSNLTRGLGPKQAQRRTDVKRQNRRAKRSAARSRAHHEECGALTDKRPRELADVGSDDSLPPLKRQRVEVGAASSSHGASSRREVKRPNSKVRKLLKRNLSGGVDGEVDKAPAAVRASGQVLPRLPSQTDSKNKADNDFGGYERGARKRAERN